MLNTPEYYIERYSILRHSENMHHALTQLIKEVQADCAITDQKNDFKFKIDAAADEALRSVDWFNYPKDMFKAGANWIWTELPTSETKEEGLTSTIGYLCCIDGDDVFVVAENISDCLDKLKAIPYKKYAEMKIHKSISAYL